MKKIIIITLLLGACAPKYVSQYDQCTQTHKPTECEFLKTAKTYEMPPTFTPLNVISGIAGFAVGSALIH